MGSTHGTAIKGTVESGEVDAGGPVKIGGVGRAGWPGYVDAGDRVDAWFTRSGAQVMGAPGMTSADAMGTIAALEAGDAGNSPLWTAASVFNGALWDRLRTPNVIKTIAAVAITAGSGPTIWDPAAGKKFRLMGWSLSSSAAAALIFGDNLVGTVILRTPLLAAAGITEAPANFGNGFLSAAADNNLKLDCTANTTVSGYVVGCEE